MNIEFLMAARGRIVYDHQANLMAALLAKPDADDLASTLKDAAEMICGTPTMPPAHAIELMIADKVDDGATLPVTNAEGFGAAQWLSQAELADLPDPIPRPFVLYLAQAYHLRGEYPTLRAALEDIFENRTFV